MMIPELPNRLSKDYINSLPIIRYTGTIKVIKNDAELSVYLENIPDETFIGFDTETRPVFNRGESHSVALVQIALPEIVLLVQLKPSGLPPSLINLFERETIHKIGVALRDDIIKLQEISFFNPMSFIDLSTIAAHKGIVQTGIRALAARYLNGRISKSAQTSNWERKKLTEKQQNYAATDAWVCTQIYPELINDTNDYHDDEEDAKLNQHPSED